MVSSLLPKISEQICGTLELASPAEQSDKELKFEFEDNLFVNIIERKDNIILYSPINFEFKDDDESLKKFKQLLRVNFARLRDEEETLTWDPDLNQILLYKEIPSKRISATPITKHLEAFLNSLEFWNNSSSDEASAPTSAFG